jgi:hypothetical protein
MAQLLANGTAVGGIAFVTANGIQLAAVSDIHYQANVNARAPALGRDGVHGFTETIRVASIKGRFRDISGSGVTKAQMQNWVGIPVVLECNATAANGASKVVSGNSMWTNEVGEVDTTEGTFDIEFNGPAALTEQGA